MAFGGYTSGVTNATEHYDGSAWTAGGNMGTGRGSLGGCGADTAGLAFGGNDYNDTVNATEEYAGPGITTQICSSS